MTKTSRIYIATLVLVAGVVACFYACSSSSTSSNAAGTTSYTLNFITGTNYTLYASIAGGTPHQVQLDTGSLGLYVPKNVVGNSAQISTTETCSITYVSSGNALTGHKATGVITLLGSKTTGDVTPSPVTVSMSFCAIDDETFTGGMMGVGFGRNSAGPTQNVLLQISDIQAGTMHPGYILSTHPTSNVQIGITAARAANFQTIQLLPSTTITGDWLASSLTGCVSLPDTPAFVQECGGLLVDTGVGETILWGLSDKTLGGIVAPGDASAPNGTAVKITTETSTALDYSYVLGTGTDTPSAVDIRNAGTFSINTGRALIVDYDYLFDALTGLVGFQKM